MKKIAHLACSPFVCTLVLPVRKVQLLEITNKVLHMEPKVKKAVKMRCKRQAKQILAKYTNVSIFYILCLQPH